MRHLLKRLIRNPSDRELVRLVHQSRFITSEDIYRISTRCRQDTSEALTGLRRSKQLPIVGSIGRVAPKTFYPPKTYVYGSGKRGHLVHWLHVAHVQALFVEAARKLNVPLDWTQHRKHYRNVPDARIELPGVSWTLEVDNSTEGKSEGGIMGKKLDENTLIVAFKSETRFQTLCDLPGLVTYHGFWHGKEPDPAWNILEAKVWWDGQGYRAIL